MMLYSICYDISDDRRRNKVANVLRDFGGRVQFSVFEANMDSDQLNRLIRRVTPLIDSTEDSIRIYGLCNACASRINIIGRGSVTRDPDYVIL